MYGHDESPTAFMHDLPISLIVKLFTFWILGDFSFAASSRSYRWSNHCLGSRPRKTCFYIVRTQYV